jgi:hypothetical protein
VFGVSNAGVLSFAQIMDVLMKKITAFLEEIK